MAWFAGKGSETRNVVWSFAGLIVGTFVNYLCGMIMFSLITSNTLATAFFACVLPFLPTGVLKILGAAILGLSIKKLLTKRNILV